MSRVLPPGPGCLSCLHIGGYRSGILRARLPDRHPILEAPKGAKRGGAQEMRFVGCSRSLYINGAAGAVTHAWDMAGG